MKLITRISFLKTHKIIISKDNWGFGEFHINSDSGFIKPEHKIIWADNFIGKTYKLSFMADPAKMASGNNYARIRITSVRQTVEIEITAVKPGIRHEVVINNMALQKKHYKYLIIKNEHRNLQKA